MYRESWINRFELSMSARNSLLMKIISNDGIIEDRDRNIDFNL